MRILLIYLSDSNDRREFATTIAPIGIFTTAAYLEKKGHSVTVANFSHVGYKKAIKIIDEIIPDAVGISLLTHNRIDALKLAKEIRKNLPSTLIFGAGAHAAALADDIANRCPEIDYVIKGDAEISIAEILAAGRRPQRGVITGKRIENLSLIPSPSSFTGKFWGVNINEQFKFIHSGRGCNNSCALCCSTVSGKARYRSAEEIIDDIETAYRRYGIIYFSFRDDLFISKKELVEQVCDGLRQKPLNVMWNCQGSPKDFTFDLLVRMKQAGCERIFLNAESGSEKILAQITPATHVEDILRTSCEIRRAGIYLSYYLRSGIAGEKHADIQKTIKLIRTGLPGEGIVSPAVYYPGSPLCKQAITSGVIATSVFFNAHEKGIYIRRDEDIRVWTQEIRDALSIVRDKSWYTAKDFKEQKHNSGETWVGDILEGDFYLDRDDYRHAEDRYSHVISTSHNNPWGYLRMGKLRFRAGDFASAEGYFAKVTSIVPGYYGGWLKLSESQIAQGKRKEARASLDHAWERNRWDLRVVNLKKVL
jgi:radical SAM superfamily enzyme YgiQ (UPF0313 family)